MRTAVRLTLLSLAAAQTARAQDPIASIRPERQAHVMVLGMFHFQDAGLDGYKPVFPLDIRSPERQREIEDVITRLAAWRPTRIAIESRPEHQARLDSLFRIYPGNGMDTLRNETYQIGFRLARKLGLPGVVAVDAPARHLDSTRSDEEWKRRSAALAKGPLAATGWDARFTAMYRADDSLKTVRTLRETLLHINSPERLLAGHGHYLVGDMFNGPVGDYFGADGFVSAWYNRNIRIYSNLARLVRNEDERILVIFGAGHVPILRELLRSSPALRLDDVTAALR